MRKIFIFPVIILAVFIASCKDEPTGGFVNRLIEMDAHTISVELPNDFVIDASDNSDNLNNINLFASEFYNFDLFGPANPDIPMAKIKKDGAVIGAVSLVNFEDIPDEQFEYYKESHSFRALYFQLPMGSMVIWGEEYETVYESENLREGTATVLAYYRSDYLEQQNITDFSRFKQETAEGDPRINLYNRGVLGYNLDLNKFVKIEVYHDAVTDEELSHIAGSLRISAKN